MTLRSLRIFVTVAEVENMTKAAEQLIITQSSISQAISDIEDEYSVILFDRLKNGIHLTAVGEGMYKYAKHILSLYDELQNVLRHDSTNPRIRIGASATVGSTILRDIVKELTDKIPSLDYSAFVGNTHIIEEKLLKNELDVGIVEGNVGSKDLHTETIAKDKMILICSPSHKFYGKSQVSINELADEPFILREEGSGTRLQLVKQLEALKIEPKIAWTCNSPDVVKSAVKQGLGISAISARLVYDDLANGSLWSCNISDAELSRDFKLVYHKDKFFTKTMNEFVNITRARGKSNL